MKYNKKIAEKIVSLVEHDTYTIKEICKIVGISEAVFFKWKKEKIEFLELLQKANDDRMNFFVSEAKKSLLKKLTGYTVQEKHTIMQPSKEIGSDGKQVPRIKEQKIIEKHFQPDSNLIMFTLTNGDSENWKNKHTTNINGNLDQNITIVEQPLFPDVPKDEK